MTRGGPVWRKLGIAPTDDKREIRRAYAAKLKVIDVENDSQGFIALREAFEQAQQEAEWMRYEAGEDGAGEDAAAEDADLPAEAPLAPIAPQSGPVPVAAQLASPWAPPTPEQIDARASALAALLHRNDEQPRPWPSDAERAEMIDHLRVILGDPRLQRIDFQGDVENWLARLIGYTIPFSDTLIVPVTEYFGWMRNAGTIDEKYGQAEITDRYGMLRFIEDVQHPDSPHLEAWRELTTPADNHAKRGKIKRDKINNLLGLVRATNPAVERSFDPYRVALWEKPSGTNSGWAWIAYILVLLLFFAGASALRTSTVPLNRALLNDQRADVQLVLDNVGDKTLKLPELERRNPGLAQLLKTNWEISHDEGSTLLDYAERMRTLLGERARAQLSVASDSILADHIAIVIDQTNALRSESAEKCMAFLTGTAPAGHTSSPEMQKRGAALTSRILLETTVEPPEKPMPEKFSIPGDIFKKAAARAELSIEDMRLAAVTKATPAQNCAARVSLMEVVREMPPGPERTRLLRSL